MKKIPYLILFLLVLASCKFDPDPYSYDREFDKGTYITPEGIVKYISGTPDSAVTVRDNYALILEEILYIKQSGGINHDSILIYGHCYSEFPNPLASPADSLITLERIRRYSNIFFDGASQPERFINADLLDIGSTFTSGFGLQYETDYYVRSFVVTGRFNGGEPVYEHIAYNQNELMFTTKSPVDLWVGGTMQEAPLDFPDLHRGATSFTYDGYMFVAQGHNEAPFGSQIDIYRYDPVSNTWDHPYPNLTIGEDENFTDGVAFVIENAPIGNNNYRDCVYIGTGKKQSGLASEEFYRLDLEQGSWVNITSTHGAQSFPGNARYDAVAFSINGIGYVGLGTLGNGSVLKDFYKFDPDDRDPEEYAYGKWIQIDDFPGGTRTKAVKFKIDDNVYVCCGQVDEDGLVYSKDVRMCRQSTGDWLSWENKKDFEGTARVDAVGFNIGEMGFVGTGWDGDSARSDFYRYNPYFNLWERRADYGGLARFEAVGEGIMINDNDYRGYLGTGWDSTKVIGSQYYSDFWHYRP